MEHHLTPENSRAMHEVRMKLDRNVRGKNVDARKDKLVARAETQYARRLSELTFKLDSIPKHSLKARMKVHNDINTLKRTFGVPPEAYDNYGVLDALKGKEKRYSPKCGIIPVQSSTETPEDFKKRTEKYNACVIVEEEIYKKDTQTQADQIGSGVEQGKGWLDQILGKGGSSSGGVYYDTSGAESDDKILGLPKVAFYSAVVLIVILVLYLLFFKGKK